MAARCGEQVEVLAGRSEWNTLYARPDGSRELVSSVSAVRTKVSGDWAEIDSSLTSSSDGLVVASPAVPMTFSDGRADQPLARITRDGHELTFDVPFDLPVPQVSGSQVTYPAVLPGVDLVVTVNADATGFSEVLRVASAEAAANPRLRELQFPIETSHDLTVVDSQGGFEATDASGETVFWSPTPQMWDSSAPVDAPVAGKRSLGLDSWLDGGLSSSRQTPEGAGTAQDRSAAPVGGERTAVMPETLSEGVVTVTPDAGLLTDPATVWPVYIDPAVSGSLNA
ncbi:MAG: hypothetical protein L6367_13610 [Cellulomonas sp.]|nr:hypothetical protein [Cellulomonas sp.]